MQELHTLPVKILLIKAIDSKKNKEEKEYIENLKELGDTDLQNPRIRRMLGYERENLSISEKRTLDLEKHYCSQ